MNNNTSCGLDYLLVIRVKRGEKIFNRDRLIMGCENMDGSSKVHKVSNQPHKHKPFQTYVSFLCELSVITLDMAQMYQMNQDSQAEKLQARYACTLPPPPPLPLGICLVEGSFTAASAPTRCPLPGDYHRLPVHLTGMWIKSQDHAFCSIQE